MAKPHVTAIAVCRYDDFPSVDPAARVSIVRVVADQATAEREVARLDALRDKHPRSRYFTTPARIATGVLEELQGRTTSCSADAAAWWPDWATGDQAVMFRARGGRVHVSWKVPGAARPAAWLAQWVQRRLELLPLPELGGPEEYVIVVLERLPDSEEPDGEVGGTSPVSRFGYGSAQPSMEPAEPLPLRDLLAGAVAALS